MRASLVPSAPVIPDPIVYTKGVAVENLVVGLLVRAIGPTLSVGTCIVSLHTWGDPACCYTRLLVMKCATFVLYKSIELN